VDTVTIKIPVGVLAGIGAALLALALVFGGIGIGVVSGWGDAEVPELDRHIERCYELEQAYLDTDIDSVEEDEAYEAIRDEGCWR